MVFELTANSIHDEFQKGGAQIKKGDELGYFQFVEGRVKFDQDISELSKHRIQVSVEVGMSLGTATRATRRDERSPKPSYAEVANLTG
jgi:hypothetical protein